MPRVVDVPQERYDRWRQRFESNNPDGPQRIVSEAPPLPIPLAVLLIRRGGYAVAVVGERGIVAHKVGTRHGPSRTAAGGWSQQRFARRRANQADALVGAVQDHLDRVLHDLGRPPAALVTGGDRQLVSDVLADPRLADLADLPARAYPDIADPRRAILDETIRRATGYAVSIDDGDGS